VKKIPRASSNLKQKSNDVLIIFLHTNKRQSNLSAKIRTDEEPPGQHTSASCSQQNGDEKTVRRSFIRFKGERHYLNSETLDNAPLNNPEHFLQPIKNNSDIPNSPLHKFASKLSPSLTDRTSDTKRTSNNTDDESFDDSLYEVGLNQIRINFGHGIFQGHP